MPPVTPRQFLINPRVLLTPKITQVVGHLDRALVGREHLDLHRRLATLDTFGSFCSPQDVHRAAPFDPRGNIAYIHAYIHACIQNYDLA
jgi:hypothetical protein